MGTTTPTTFTPGTVLVGVWGSEQTNVDFYVVTRATDRTVWFRPVAQRVERLTGFMAETVVPAPGEPTGPEERRRIIEFPCGHQAKTPMGHLLSVWDGEPVRQSHYA